jgi:hypothetical protein
MANFLICGLPRSRTYWFSRYMSPGNSNSICCHEPIVYMDNKEDIKDHYDGCTGFKHIGISDSSAGFFIEYILEEIKPQILVIERDIGAVEKSLESLGLNLPTHDYCTALKEKYDSITGHPLVLNCPYEMLNDANVMREITEHLTPGIPFNEEYFNLMTHRHLQIDVHGRMGYVMKNKGKLVNEIRSFL